MGIIGSAFVGTKRVYGVEHIPSSTDSDVQAFIDAVYDDGGELSSTEVIALDNLVTSLKTTGAPWTSARAIYPLVGGTQASCAVNLKNPGTNDLGFDANWSFDSTGATCLNGTASTGLQAGVSPYIRSYGVYIGNNVAETRTDIGGSNNGIIARSSPSEWARICINSSCSQTLSGVITDSRGWYYGYGNLGINRDYLFKNGSTLASGTLSETYISNNLFLGNGSTKNYRFGYIGDGSVDFYSTIQAFQTTLGRAV